MYTTPIIYPIDIIDKSVQWVFKLNPMYHLILVFRMPLYQGVVPGATEWLIAAAVAVATLMIGGLIFTSKSNEYAYRI
jgi:ABC-2 type transport system permease protein/lipopolysaccharide transport system permease protein